MLATSLAGCAGTEGGGATGTETSGGDATEAGGGGQTSTGTATPSGPDEVVFGQPAGISGKWDFLQPAVSQASELLTGSLELANADVRLKQQENGQYRLASVLEAVEDEYQSILIDCAPSTSILSVNALIAADAFIIPVTPSYLALEGVVSLGEVVRRVRRGIGEAAPILGLALTMVDRSEPQVDDAIEQLRNHYGGKVFDTVIRKDPKLEEAPSRNMDIFRYAPDSQGAQDYQKLIDEVEERLQRYGSVYGSLQNGGANGTSQNATPAPDADASPSSKASSSR